MSNPKGRPKSATLGVNTLVRLPPDMKAELISEAKRDNRTLSGHIRHILAHHLSVCHRHQQGKTKRF